MSSLTVYPADSPEQPNKVLTHAADIAATLAPLGVRFGPWEAATGVRPGASHEDVLAAYSQQIEMLKEEVRARLRKEYRHGEDEVRFFVAGRGLFNLHIEDHVYAVLCEKGDLISIPAGTRHWVDIGEQPYLVVIRLYNNAGDVRASYTGDSIAERFPELDSYL
jgi:1,2-dihydroxy-3-keto-5-methylthiopentene dioxygenase